MSIVTAVREEVRYTPQEEIERGRHAALLLNDPILSEAFAEAERLFVNQWLEGETVNAREAAWAKIHALDAVQRVLHAIVGNGEHAEAVTTSRRKL